MTYEIKLHVGSPHVLRDHLRRAANYYPPGTDTRHTLEDALVQVEAQLPKPTVEEPTEWGSVVLAQDTAGSERMRWVRLDRRLWRAERNDYASTWDRLKDVEVLRVGVGDAS